MKICLIGNNLTSLILANILSKKNFIVEIYSLKSSNSKFKTRTLGITNHNIKYLSDFFPNIYKITNPVDEIKILIQNRKQNDKIVFNESLKPLFYMVKYDNFYLHIKSQTSKNKYIKFKYLKNKSKIIKLKKKNNFSLIINCESSNILTNKFLKKGIIKNYFNKAFTTIIKHSKLKNNTATQVFTENGPIAYLPLSKSLTSVVFSIENKKQTEISEKNIYKKILEFNPGYKIISRYKFENFKLYLRLPKKYYFNNILFFGDSLHSIHPLAGQGFNMIIRDIIKLSEIIDEKNNLGLVIDKNIYKEFEKKTKSLNSVFSLGIDLIYELFRINKNLVPHNISRNIISFINKNKKIKDLSIKYANFGNL